MSLRGKVEIVGMTDTGRVRTHNEDYIGLDEDLGLAVLADGMGGTRAGEVASAMAVSVVTDELRSALPGLPVRTGEDEVAASFSAESDLIGRSVARANASIYSVAQSQPQCAGMGTTLVVMLFYDNRFTVAHVGDSRLYRLRRGDLEQVTVDHSLIQELIDRGFYTPQEARRSANRNIVTRALGIAPEVEYDLQEEVAIQGDIFLLCSDGLNDMLEDQDIAALIGDAETDLQAACKRLVDAANDCGGKDNVSVMLARVLKPYPARSGLFGKLTRWFE